MELKYKTLLPPTTGRRTIDRRRARRVRLDHPPRPLLLPLLTSSSSPSSPPWDGDGVVGRVGLQDTSPKILWWLSSMRQGKQTISVLRFIPLWKVAYPHRRDNMHGCSCWDSLREYLPTSKRTWTRPATATEKPSSSSRHPAKEILL